MITRRMITCFVCQGTGVRSHGSWSEQCDVCLGWGRLRVEVLFPVDSANRKQTRPIGQRYAVVDGR